LFLNKGNLNTKVLIKIYTKIGNELKDQNATDLYDFWFALRTLWEFCVDSNGAKSFG